MNKILFEKTSNNLNASKRIRPIYKAIIITMVLALIIFSFSQINFKWNSFGSEIFNKNIKKLFSFQNNDPSFPSHTVLENSLNYLWKTIRITITGTILGYLLAFLTSFMSSKKVMNKYISFGFRFFILFLRSFPLIIFVYAAQLGFEKEFAAVLILFWFSWIWTNKYLQQIIDNIDFEGYKHYQKIGYKKPYAFNKQIFSRGKNKYIAIFLYSLESNLRWTTMLATIGVVGLGFFIDQNIKNNFELIGIPLSLLFLVIISIELLSVFMNKVLLVIKSNKQEKINWKKIINWLLLLTITLIAIYQLCLIDYNKISLQNFFSFFQHILSIDYGLWSSGDPNNNSWLLIIQLIYQVIAILTIVVIYALITSIFASEKRNKRWTWIPLKILNNFIKIIPILVLFYLLNPLSFSPIGLGIIIIGIHSGSIMSNQLVGFINNIDDKIIIEYKKNGYSKLQIIRKLIFPTIVKDIKSLSALRAEVIFRNVIILGVLGLSVIGSQISAYYSRTQMAKFSAHIWAITIIIFTYNIIPFVYRKVIKIF